MTARRVVVTGYGIVSPVGIGAEASWDALVAGRSGIDRITLFDTEPFLHEHLAIVRNLEKGRIGKAAELLREHLLVSRERATERIRSLEGKFSPDNLPYLTLMSPT